MANELDKTIAVVNLSFPGSVVVMTNRPCRLCGADLLFIKDPKGRMMVLDSKPEVTWYIDERRGEARPFKSHRMHRTTCPRVDDSSPAGKSDT